MIFDPTAVASQVGYGKTAAVLALIALTRLRDAAPAPLPTRQTALQKTKRIPSQATLVMLPPNLQLAEKKGPLDVLWWVISYELADIFYYFLIFEWDMNGM